jgi:hypothetical protein
VEAVRFYDAPDWLLGVGGPVYARACWWGSAKLGGRGDICGQVPVNPKRQGSLGSLLYGLGLELNREEILPDVVARAYIVRRLALRQERGGAKGLGGSSEKGVDKNAAGCDEVCASASIF